MADYPELRNVLGSPYRNASAEDIENFMERLNLNAEDTEDFLGTLGNIGKGIVGALPQVLPAALPIVGTAIGGPIGGMVGSFAGKALGSAVSPGRPAAPATTLTPAAPSPLPVPVPPPQPTASAAAPAVPQIPGSSPAANELMRAMFRPETLNALLAMIFGQAGKQNVPVGNTPVPVGAFTNLIGTLANQAAAEYSAGVARGPHPARYASQFEDYAGEAYGDTAVPENRAEALLQLFRESDSEQYEADTSTWEHDQSYESDPELDELYDEMDAAELDGIYEFA